MSIVMVGSTSGSITLQEPAVAGSTVLDLPATSGTILTTGSSGQSIPKAALPTGSVLQVVNVAYDTFTSTSSATYADTGLTASITPLFSSSRILVMVHQNGVGKANNQQVSIQLVRNSTAISKLGEDDGNTGTTATNYFGSVSTCRFDSPATTSATTYKTQFRTPSAGSAAYVQLGQAVSTITLMEIAT